MTAIATDLDVPFFNDSNSVYCSCCQSLFVPDHSAKPTSLVTSSKAAWLLHSERINMCSACVSLSSRRRTKIRTSRRELNQAKAAHYRTTSPYSLDELNQRKVAKANDIRSRAIEFSRNIKQIIPQRHSYYLHALVWHFPAWIEALDIDVMDVSGSGIEMINQETKKAFK